MAKTTKKPTQKEVEQWKKKAEKWDALDKVISEYYIEPGEEGYDAAKDDNGLLGIGEDAARAFGYM